MNGRTTKIIKVTNAIARPIVISAGARPRLALVHEQTWESFSQPWNTDVKIAFQVGQTAIRQPLRPGSQVIIISSGAGLGVFVFAAFMVLREGVETVLFLHSFPPNITGLDEQFQVVNGHTAAGNTPIVRARVGPAAGVHVHSEPLAPDAR